MGSHVSSRQVVSVFTTPRELRWIADHMEALWANSCAGCSLEADRIMSEEIEVVFIIEQEQMARDRPR